MRWAELTIEATEQSSDAVSNILVEEGCAGTALSTPSSSNSDSALDLVGYLPVDDRLEARLGSISQRVRRLPSLGLKIRSPEIGVKWVQDEKWATAWKKFFKPLRVGKIIIKPSWESYSPQRGDVVVELDPGMAFGTGTHPTTQLCLLALQKLIKGGETVLDMGTGSGILALASVHLGAARVVGLDIDPIAVDAANKNAAKAGFANLIKAQVADSPEAFDGTADVVLANIVANVIILLAEGLKAKVKQGGTLVASGIIQERASEVREKLENAGFEVLDELHDGEWVALICKGV